MTHVDINTPVDYAERSVSAGVKQKVFSITPGREYEKVASAFTHINNRDELNLIIVAVGRHGFLSSILNMVSKMLWSPYFSMTIDLK